MLNLLVTSLPFYLHPHLLWVVYLSKTQLHFCFLRTLLRFSPAFHFTEKKNWVHCFPCAQFLPPATLLLFILRKTQRAIASSTATAAGQVNDCKRLPDFFLFFRCLRIIINTNKRGKLALIIIIVFISYNNQQGSSMQKKLLWNVCCWLVVKKVFWYFLSKPLKKNIFTSSSFSSISFFSAQFSSSSSHKSKLEHLLSFQPFFSPIQLTRQS